MKKILIGLFCATLLTLTGCAKKCPSGYEKEEGKCVQYVDPTDVDVIYSCDEGWNFQDGECVNGTMPPIGDGCEVGTTDRIGEDGFCHHYAEPTVEKRCWGEKVLKDDKCYTKNVK